MSCYCIIEPAGNKAALQDLCAALGVKDTVPPEATVTQVIVFPNENAWELTVSCADELHAMQRDALARSLAAALGLNRLELRPSTVSAAEISSAPSPVDPPVDQEHMVEETDEIIDLNGYSDEDYMEMLARKMRNSQAANDRTQAEKGAGGSTVLMGQAITQDPQPIRSIQDEERSIVITGKVIDVKCREMRSGRTAVSFNVTDFADTITVKHFADEKDTWVEKLAVGLWVKVRGAVQYDKYTQELTVLPKDICTTPPVQSRQDTATEKRVELHLHTKMSALDGVAHVKDMIAQAKAWGHPAVAITDHGVVQAFPDAFAAAQKHDMKVIYGVEGYLCDDPEEKGPTFHVIILAKNLTGLHNLYRLVSCAHLDYFYRRPRYPRHEINRLREGLIIGSACEAGELFQAVIAGATDERLEQIASFYDYLEIQPLSNNQFLLESGRARSEEDLRAFNRRIVALGKRLNKPVVATSDAHYINPEDDIYRRILMAGHGFTDTENAARLYLKTTDEMLAEFSYLGEETAYEVVVTNARRIADGIDELRPIPQGFYPPELEGAADQVRRMSQQRAEELYGNPLPELVAARLEKELQSIVGNGFSSLYLIAHKLVKKSVDDGYLVGSRGSVGSSLVALLCGISEVNPLPPHYVCRDCRYFAACLDGTVDAGIDLPAKNCPRCGKPLVRDGFNIPFETFLGFEGDKTPDIDLNFSGDYQPRAHKYTEELFGKENVFRAGTIGSLAEKTAFGFVSKYMEENNIHVRTAEKERLAAGLAGVRRTTGQHPGGMIVVPKGREIFEFTPIQYPANNKESGIITTHFEFNAIHDQLLKLDILGHDGPTMIRLLEEMTQVRALDIPLDDPATMSLFSSLDALGITPAEAGATVGTLALPEFNTSLLRQMLEDTRPKTFADLVRIMGLSHGTLVWIGNQQDLVRNKTITLSETIACRDDILEYLVRKGMEAQRAFKIMEQVRKGRGLTEEDEQLMRDHNVPAWYIETCKKITYMFPKAHAAAYAIMAFWQGYYKVHHPLEFYAAYFTVRAGEFDANLVLQGRKAVQKALKDIEQKGNDATAKEKGAAAILEVVLEAMARGIEFLPVDLYKSDVRKFRRVNGKLLCPLTSLQGLGDSAAESLVQARSHRPFTSVEDLKKRGNVSRAVIDALTAHGALTDLPLSDQLTLF
ncbi:MAG: PolC-type DNA polymerase III [Limnochordia bacterium]|jgi:DNA polymerase-3 subunit alpha (Gram-positive type)